MKNIFLASKWAGQKCLGGRSAVGESTLKRRVVYDDENMRENPYRRILHFITFNYAGFKFLEFRN